MEYRRKLSDVGGGGGAEKDIKEKEEEMEARNDMNVGKWKRRYGGGEMEKVKKEAAREERTSDKDMEGEAWR